MPESLPHAESAASPLFTLTVPEGPSEQEILTAGAREFLAKLTTRFEPVRRQLLLQRANPAQTILALSAIEVFVPAGVSVLLSRHIEYAGACARARPAGVRNEERGQSVHRRHKRRATLLHGYDGMRAGLQIACRRQIETK